MSDTDFKQSTNPGSRVSLGSKLFSIVKVNFKGFRMYDEEEWLSVEADDSHFSSAEMILQSLHSWSSSLNFQEFIHTKEVFTT